MMKTANVADLRNNFATVSRWIYDGESVSIQKRGKPFAILAPVEPCEKKTASLPNYEVRLRQIFKDKNPSGASAEELVDYLRGDY